MIRTGKLTQILVHEPHVARVTPVYLLEVVQKHLGESGPERFWDQLAGSRSIGRSRASINHSMFSLVWGDQMVCSKQTLRVCLCLCMFMCLDQLGDWHKRGWKGKRGDILLLVETTPSS